MHDRLKEVVDNLLKPLLQQDDSEINLISVGRDAVTVELHGRAAFGAGATLVQSEVIKPALEKAAGRYIQILLKKAPPRPRDP